MPAILDVAAHRTAATPTTLLPARPVVRGRLTAADSRECSGERASTSGRPAHATAKPIRGNRPASTAFAASLAPSSSAGGVGPAGKHFDVVALGNLCVDIVVPMEELPTADVAARRALLEALSARSPDVGSWEVGGQTNLLIAAARMGLRAASVGHVGDDVYGRFLAGVLEGEGVQLVPLVPTAALTPQQNSTLLCFVLVAPNSSHAFCSSYDFGPWPLLSFVDRLPPGTAAMLDDTAALFINGFVFDEVPAEVVLAAAQRAQAAGAAVFFDPGPRAWTFGEGARRAALSAILDLSDVVLMTEEEAEAVTGCSGAEAAARHMLGRPGARTEWCVVKRGAEGALLAARSPGAVYEQSALKVDVRDTVGCGDSFASAVVLGYTRQHSIPAVMALASAVGAATAMGTGAGRNVARAEQVMALLEGAAGRCGDGRHRGAMDVLAASLTSMDLDSEGEQPCVRRA